MAHADPPPARLWPARRRGPNLAAVPPSYENVLVVKGAAGDLDAPRRALGRDLPSHASPLPAAAPGCASIWAIDARTHLQRAFYSETPPVDYARELSLTYPSVTVSLLSAGFGSQRGVQRTWRDGTEQHRLECDLWQLVAAAADRLAVQHRN